MDLYSTATAAERLKVSARTIQRACERHDIGQRIGKGIVLTEADLKRLRQHVPGRAGCPDFTPGNQLWKRRKISTSGNAKSTKDLRRGKTAKRKSA